MASSLKVKSKDLDRPLAVGCRTGHKPLSDIRSDLSRLGRKMMQWLHCPAATAQTLSYTVYGPSHEETAPTRH